MLDRALQRRILEALAALYPEGTYDLPQAVSPADGGEAPDERRVLVNTQYLAEHGLLESGFARRGTLGDDGGLGAVLGTVTVRLDAAQWAELLARKVEAAPGLSHADRSSIAATLRSLPAKAIGTVFEKLLDWAVDHSQDALPLLRMWLSQAAG